VSAYTRDLKEIVDFSDPSIPVRAYITNYQGSVSPHLHHEIELLYMLSGTMTVQVADDVFTLRWGEVAVINSHVVHSTISTDPNAYMCLLQFNPDVLIHSSLASEYKYAIPFLCQDRFHYRVIRPQDGEQQREIAMLLTDTANEFQYKDTGYEIMIKANLYRLLALMFRNHHIPSQNVQPPQKEVILKNKLSKVIDYVEKHYDESIEVSQAAELVNLNPDYFCRLFKTATGQSFVQYLNNVRVSVAERLLLTTDKLITDILVETGFSSLSYFNRMFRKIKNCCPSEYRKEAFRRATSLDVPVDLPRQKSDTA
jgi:AraC family transcriptional regulator, transcriptional activator of pobA